MAIKIYESKRWTHLSISVNVKGEETSRNVEFTPGYNFGPYRQACRLRTNDKKLQDAIEANEGFNSKFVLVQTIEEPKVKETKADETKPAEPAEKEEKKTKPHGKKTMDVKIAEK